MTWSNAIDNFCDYLLIERGLSNNTAKGYASDICKLVDYLKVYDQNVSPINIEEYTLRGFIYHTAKSIESRSQARLISALKTFFKFIIFEDHREDNPMDLIESPKIGRKLPDTLSLEEIDKLVSVIDLSKPYGMRNRTIIEMLYGCGLRVSELINLTISNLFFDEGFILVTGKGDKQRFVPVEEITIKYINLYIKNIRNHVKTVKGEEDIIFLNNRNKRLSRVMIFNIVRNLAEYAGIKKIISPHTFRHSFATHLMQNGADISAIQQMLGHESISTTEIYMHMDQRQLAETINRFHPRVHFK